MTQRIDGLVRLLLLCILSRRTAAAGAPATARPGGCRAGLCLDGLAGEEASGVNLLQFGSAGKSTKSSASGAGSTSATAVVGGDAALGPPEVEPLKGEFDSEHSLKGEFDSVHCGNVDVPEIKDGAFVCSPRDVGTQRFPLFVWGHGDWTAPEEYSALMTSIASFGFVVASYRSCIWVIQGNSSSECQMGQGSFLEALKLVDAFVRNPDMNPAQAPVDVSRPVVVGGHSTGARAALMVAAVRDSPTYLKGTWFGEQLDKDGGALRKAAGRVGAVVSLHPDPMDDDVTNPDVEGFFGAVTQTPAFIETSVDDFGEPDGAAWRDFLSLRSPSKIYLDMSISWRTQFSGHMEPIDYGLEAPWAAVFAQALALGNGTAKELLYGSCEGCFRHAFPHGTWGERNTGKGNIGLLLCGQNDGGSFSVPAEFAEFCNATSQ